MHDERRWEDLLERVLPILNAHPEYTWTLGGGTALYLSLRHRISKDIDLFFTNANVLKKFAPSRNTQIASICDSFQQPGHYIRLEVRGVGEIDFLVTREFHDTPAFVCPFHDQKILVEYPGEIISKKLYFRASQFTIRDIFDFASCIVEFPDFSEAIHPDVHDKIPLAIDVVQRRANEYRGGILEEIIPLDVEEEIFISGPEMVLETLSSVLKKSGHHDPQDGTKTSIPPLYNPKP